MGTLTDAGSARATIALTLIVLGVSPTARAQVPILHYTFDDGVSPTANAGSLGPAQNGQLRGNAAFTPFGAGSAVRFDGAHDWVIPVGDENDFDIADGDFTVALTVQTTTLEPGELSHRFVVIKEKAGDQPGWQVGVQRGTGIVGFFLGDGTSGWNLWSNLAVNDGAAHEIMVVRERSALLVFIDGAYDGCATMPPGFGSTRANSRPLVIGGRSLNGTGPTFGAADDFDGVIDEIRIYNRALATRPVCYADCDANCGIDIFDFLCFQNRYDTRDPYSCNCDTQTGPDLCDIFDFLCFQNAFAASCP